MGFLLGGRAVWFRDNEFLFCFHVCLHGDGRALLLFLAS